MYGFGKACRWYVQFLHEHNIKISGIIDGNKNFWGSEAFVLPVMSLDEALQKGVGAIVISAQKYAADIKKILLKKIPQDKIYSFETELYCNFIHDAEIYRQFLLENWNRVEDAYSSLSDIYSKNTFINFIKGRCTADTKYFFECMEQNQYYPKDIVSFSENETFVELGSYDGKTFTEWLDLINRKYHAAYLFEPDAECLKKLKAIKESETPEKITIVPKAAYSSCTVLHFSNIENTGTSHITDGKKNTVSIETETIDNFIKEKITYIKMDIEGSEIHALKGSEHHLIEDRPKLAVCVYHNMQDFLEIIEYLKQLDLGYTFYLRHHNCSATETVLYAV